MEKVTRNNYYSNEINQAYMSVSQFKGFLTCENMEFAKIKMGYIPKKTKALELGNYLHAWNEGILDEFTKENENQIFGRGKREYIAYLKANQAINALKRDNLCTRALQGEKEVIMQGEIDNVPWKIRVDNLHEKRFSDLKYVANFKPLYSPKFKKNVHFTEYWGYHYQMAVYQEIIRQNTGKTLEALIVAVTKETPPNKDIFRFSNDWLKDILDEVIFMQKRIILVKSGEAEPEKCGECEYCRESKKIDDVRFLNGFDY